MANRKQQLFNSQSPKKSTTVIPATVSFKIDKKAKGMKPLTSLDKMKCALRKVLADLSDKNPHGCRYYIANNKIQLSRAPDPAIPKPGEGKTYKAAGRFKAGVCHPKGNMTTQFLEFSITFKDVVDDRGLPDVRYVDPTTVDVLAKNSPADLDGVR
jgi:hypothetical protein